MRRCGASLPIRDGVLVVRDAPTDDNKIAADFYNSQLWPKVRFWEHLFWIANGGERRARDVVLRRLPNVPGSACSTSPSATASHELAPRGLVDHRRRRLHDPARRLPAPELRPRSPARLGRSRGPALPRPGVRRRLEQRRFQPFQRPRSGASRDGAGREAWRPVVVADEMPDFLNFGHRLGLPGLDRWIASRLMSMGDDFADLVERHRNIDIAAIGRRVLNDSRYEVIWRGGGYLMVGKAP